MCLISICVKIQGEQIDIYHDHQNHPSGLVWTSQKCISRMEWEMTLGFFVT
jgi:hypothetical protein